MDEHASETVVAEGSVAGVDLEDSIEPELTDAATLLPEMPGRVGEVAACLANGVMEPKAIVDAGAAANTGAVSSYLATIRAIEGKGAPTAPTMARSALASTRSFLKSFRDRLLPEEITRLEKLLIELDSNANNAAAKAEEEAELKDKTDSLSEVLAAQGGVYVFTYPHYWAHKYVEGTERTLLKVGMSTKEAKMRVKQQAKLTGMPEDPLLLRVYQHPVRTPLEVERSFHRLLDAADHDRSGTTTGGREWFITSIEFLDAVAHELGLTIIDGDHAD